jgi:hypothetical protein
MQSITMLTISCYCFMLFLPCYAIKQESVMIIENILDNVITANRGSNHDIKVGDIFYLQKTIQDSTVTCGKAKVIILHEEKCGLKIIEKNENVYVKKGDILTKTDLNNQNNSTLLREANTQKFNKSQLSQEINYYSQGRSAAENDYSGGGAVAGGLLAGFGLGLIGWGIGYLIVSNMDVEVPNQYTDNLEEKDKIKFSDGYTVQVDSKRNSSYNTGAVIGVICAVVVVTSLNKK